MTNAELNRAVAHATGESIHEIRHRGFIPLSDCETASDDDLVGQFIDWDDLDERRNVCLFHQPEGAHLLD